jgi:hypothetical protein
MIQQDAMLVFAHIDIHKNIHYATASAFNEDGTMRKCWHGTFPNQGRLHFDQRNPPMPIRSTETYEAPIINELVDAITFFGRAQWTKPNGVKIPTQLITIDFRWGMEYVMSALTNCIDHSGKCLLYMGMPIMPDNLPVREYKCRPGDGIGDYWWLNTNNSYERPILKVDVNAMKEKLHMMLTLEPGKIGSVSLGGGPPQTTQSIHWNSMLIDHLFSQEPVVKVGKKYQRTKICFVDKDGKPDDHYFDCLVANLVMADVYGCRAVKLPHTI